MSDKRAPMTPSSQFDAYVTARVFEEHGASVRMPNNEFVNSLWAAATFDWFQQSGKSESLLDVCGIPRVEAVGYANVIELAASLHRMVMVSYIQYDEYRKAFPLGLMQELGKQH